MQRAWRAHAFRVRLAWAPALRCAMLHAVVRLQALWRGRPARQAFLQQRAAAVKLQVRNPAILPMHAEHKAYVAPSSGKASSGTGTGHARGRKSMVAVDAEAGCGCRLASGAGGIAGG